MSKMLIQKAIYSITGVMPKKLRLSTCEEIGQKLSLKNLETGKLPNAEDVSSLLREKLSAKDMSKIKISTDKETAANFMLEEGLMPSYDVAKEYIDNSLSAAIPGPKSFTNLLNLRFDVLSTEEGAMNTVSHELQHLLLRTNSPQNLSEKLLIKLRGQKWFNEYVQKYAGIINGSSMDLQQFLLGRKLGWIHAAEGTVKGYGGKTPLLSITGDASMAELRGSIQDFIRGNILLPNCDSRNLKLLRALRFMLKDEAHSYGVGGNVQRFYQKASTQAESVTRSDAMVDLYKEARNVLKGEVRNQRLNRLRKFFGMKQKDYSIKPNMSNVQEHELTKAEIEEMLKFKDLSPSDKKDIEGLLRQFE